MERHAAGTFREDRRAKAALAELTHLAVAPANWLCSICRDVVQHDPVSLPCGHSYCRGCLMKVLADSSSQQAGNGSPGRGRCPMCRAVVPSADAVRPNDGACARACRPPCADPCAARSAARRPRPPQPAVHKRGVRVAACVRSLLAAAPGGVPLRRGLLQAQRPRLRVARHAPSAGGAPGGAHRTLRLRRAPR